jgi:hypothetical protein
VIVEDLEMTMRTGIKIGTVVDAALAFTSAPASINALAALILLPWVAINSAVRR